MVLQKKTFFKYNVTLKVLQAKIFSQNILIGYHTTDDEVLLRQVVFMRSHNFYNMYNNDSSRKYSTYAK